MHRTVVRSFAPFLGSLLALCALGAGCDDATPATPDSGAPLDVTGQPDAMVTPDAAPDATATPDAAADVAPDAAPATPSVVALSATGHDRFFGVTFDPMGAFYAVGVMADGVAATDDFRTVVVKFNADGTRATGFGTMGVASHNLAVGTNGEVARGVVVQPSGKVVALATVDHPGPGMEARDRDIALVRFNADGTRDLSFGAMGVVTLDLSTGEAVGTGFVADSAWGLTMYSDGRLLVSGSQKRMGGTDSDFAVVRLSADGVRDNTFGTMGVATVDINNRSASPRNATILDDGSIVMAGYMDDGGVVKPVLFKLNSTGALVPGFGTMGVFAPTVLAAVTEAYGAVLQGTSFVTAGYGRSSAMENLDWVSLRVTAAGALDTTWGTQGVVRMDVAMFNDNARAIVGLPNNRVMLVGGGRPTETNVDAMIAVLGANGAPDTTYGPRGFRTWDLGGASDFFWGAALSPDRTRVAVVGTRAVAAGMGNDDAAVYLVPVP